MRVGVVVQARMGSTRFPGKVLEDLAGRPMLDRLVERLLDAGEVDEIVIATTSRPEDDVLASHCARAGWPVVRGSEEDVLGRFAEAARARRLDVVARACADAPLTDPGGIDVLVRRFREGGARVVHSRHPRGWPVGTAADVFAREALEEADAAARLPHQREHVVPYFMENPDAFGTTSLDGPEEWLEPSYHLAVDYPEDLAWMRRLYAALSEAATERFGIAEVLAWIRATGDEPRRFDWAVESDLPR